MATGVQVWSQTPNSNATSDSNINWAEGQAPSSVNDSARAMMASVAKWRDDNSGSLLTAGTSVAYTVTTNQVEAANTSGYTVKVTFHTANGAAATLSPDGLAAAPLQVIAGSAASSGVFQAGSIWCFTYSSTGTGQWIVHGGSNPMAQLNNFTSTSTGSFTINSTSAYTDTIFVTQGTTGIWFASGTVTFTNASATDQLNAKLWDGTTVIASGSNRISSAGTYASVSLSGIITNPVANIKISGINVVGGGTISVVSTGLDTTGKASLLTAVRIG